MRPKSYTKNKRCFCCKYCRDTFTTNYGYALMCVYGDKSKKVSEKDYAKYLQDRLVEVDGYCHKYEDITP